MERNCIDMEIQKFIDIYFYKTLYVTFNKNDKGRYVNFFIKNTPHPHPDYIANIVISYDDIRQINAIFELRDMNNKRWCEFR